MEKLHALTTRVKEQLSKKKISKGAKKANVYLLLAWRACLATLAIWGIWRFNHMTESETFVLRAFTVTPEMERVGYRGETVVARILSDMLQIIYPKDSSTSRISACRQNEKARIKTQLRIADGTEKGSYDLESLFQMGKKLVGKEDKVISGYITNEPKKITLWIQIPDVPLKSISVSDSLPLDSLIYQAAIFLVRQTTPQYLANYFIQNKQFDAAEMLLAELDFSHRNMPNAKEVDGIQTLSNWANYYLAQSEFERAYLKAQELHEQYPNDIAGYALRVSVLMSQAVYFEYYEPENKATIKILAEKGFAIAREAEQKSGKMRSAYFDKNQARGLMLSNAAYLANQCQLEKPKILEQYLQKSREILPQSVYIYNNLAYFYLTQGNRDSAERYIKDALDANRRDGNLWDTYAEMMLHFKDTTGFFNCFEKALQNQKLVDGITVDEYRKDVRWRGIIQSGNKKRFQSLLDKYDINIATRVGK